MSAAVPIKTQSEDTKARPGKKSKRTAEQRANRKARKAERMSKKRAARRAAAEQSNLEHNPKRTKRAPEVDRGEKNNEASVVESKPQPSKPARRGGDGAPRAASRPATRERSARSRIAIGVLLALGLMLGFWLLFKLPAG